jgi:hypothetical protein
VIFSLKPLRIKLVSTGPKVLPIAIDKARATEDPIDRLTKNAAINIDGQNLSPPL